MSFTLLVVVIIVFVVFMAFVFGSETGFALMKFFFSAGIVLATFLFVLNVIGFFVGEFKEEMENPSEPFSESYDPFDSYSDTDSNPGYHEVDGYYNSNGTYVEPHLRTNPDGYEGNNFNN